LKIQYETITTPCLGIAFPLSNENTKQDFHVNDMLSLAAMEKEGRAINNKSMDIIEEYSVEVEVMGFWVYHIRFQRCCG
jgi:hypothetical protein